jgi:hypothetical protein
VVDPGSGETLESITRVLGLVRERRSISDCVVSKQISRMFDMNNSRYPQTVQSKPPSSSDVKIPSTSLDPVA